nr:hypothetical protein [Tanacetum cinerariifolium]
MREYIIIDPCQDSITNLPETSLWRLEEDLSLGNVKVIEEDETEPIPTMPNRSLIQSNSPTVSPFLKDSTMHIPYTNANMFANDVLANHVGDKELNSIDGVGIRVLRKKEIKKDKVGLLKEYNKEWKMNEKVDPHNK